MGAQWAHSGHSMGSGSILDIQGGGRACPVRGLGMCVSVCASTARSSAPSTPVPPPAPPMATGITARLMGSHLTSWERAKCTWSRLVPGCVPAGSTGTQSSWYIIRWWEDLSPGVWQFRDARLGLDRAHQSACPPASHHYNLAPLGASGFSVCNSKSKCFLGFYYTPGGLPSHFKALFQLALTARQSLLSPCYSWSNLGLGKLVSHPRPHN